MRPLPQPPLYLIADPSRCQPGQFLPILQSVLDAGLRWLQLRAKSLPEAQYQALCQAVLPMAKAAGATLIINGEPAWVADFGVDGVQLSSERLRQLAGQRRDPAWGLLGASCHNAEELAMADQLGADFALLSPLFPTASHPGAAALGLETFAALVEKTQMPVLALGGIKPDQVGQIMAAGACGVAVLGGILEADDPAGAVGLFFRDGGITPQK